MATTHTNAAMERAQIRKIMLTRRGSLSRIATRLQINKGLVSMALKGRHGGRVGKEQERQILAACEAEAQQILKDQEAATNA